MKRLVAIAVAVVLTCMAVMVNTAYAEHDSLTGGNEQDNGTEFHVVDDLYVGGWNGTWNDPDVEIYGFSMFGSTTAYNNRWGDWANLQGKMPTTSTGTVVILGDLVVGSTAYFHRGVEFNAISTFTAGATFPTGSSVTYSSIGNIWVNDGTAGWAIRKAANGNLEWYNPLQYGDNLGDHTATQDLDMAGHSIKNIKELQFGDANLYISTNASHFGGQGGGVNISTNAQVNGDLYVVGVVTATKFYGDASGLTGVATLTNTTPWRILRVNDSQQVIDAGIYQEGSNGITVDASSFTVVNTALFKSSVTIEGDANGVGLVVNAGKTSTFGGDVTAQANLTVNGNATIGNDTVNNTHTIKGAVTIHADPAISKKLMQIDDGTNVVAYFKKK
jgi:hypothetical protein